MSLAVSRQVSRCPAVPKIFDDTTFISFLSIIIGRRYKSEDVFINKMDDGNDEQ